MAMRALQNDRSFDESVETASEYRDAAAELTHGRFDYVIFGHTHQAKDVDLGGGARYLNSGTWADVLAFPDEIVRGEQSVALAKLREFVAAMQRGDFSQWTIFRPTYVRLDVDADDRVQAAELCHYAAQPVQA
jgi:hypothetical protein